MTSHRSWRPGRRRSLVFLTSVLAAITVALAPATSALALPICCDVDPPPPPPPQPMCSQPGGTQPPDESPITAYDLLLGTELAKAYPHIEWCTDPSTGRTTTIRKFAATNVVPISRFFINWEFVGGEQSPYIDGNGNGRYVQSIKIVYGAGIEIAGKKHGAVGSCVMTIDRTYRYSPGPRLNTFDKNDNLGDCRPIWDPGIASVNIGYTPIPEPATLPYPPVEIAWMEPDPFEYTDIVIHTTMEVVEFSWETDIIDAPLGGGGGGGDPAWEEYFVAEAEEVLA
jgi:hypothetical protein